MMEDYPAGASFKKKKRTRVIFAGLAVAILVVAGGIYFVFPATVKDILKSGTAIALRSWGDLFGASREEYIASEIDLGTEPSLPDISMASSSTPTTTDATVIAPSKTVFRERGTPKMIAKETKERTVIVHDPAVSSTVSVEPEVPAMPATPAAPTTTIASSPTAVASMANAAGNVRAGGVQAQSSPHPSAPPPPPAPPTCTVSASASTFRKIIFNEIAWMGSVPLAGENSLAASNREWIELKNVSGAAADISGWQLLDAAGNIHVVFDSGTNVAAGGFFLLERGEDAVPGISADKLYSGALSNVGGTLVLIDRACGASDILDASLGWPGGDNAAKKTLERDVGGMGWHTSTAPGGTPRAENTMPPSAVATTTPTTTTSTMPVASSTTGSTTTVPDATSTTLLCPTSTIHLVIAAIQIAGRASTNDFVKIFNPTAGAVDLGGWKLKKRAKTGAESSLRQFPDRSTIAAYGYFIWANGADGFGDMLGANATSTETLAADNSVALFDAAGAVVDAVAWGKGADQYGEGRAFPENLGAGQVLTRKFAGAAVVDTDQNADDFTMVPPVPP